MVSIMHVIILGGHIFFSSLCKAAVCGHDEPATNPEQAYGFIRGVGAGGGRRTYIIIKSRFAG